MYKNILLLIIIAFMAGCSQPTPQQYPSWYTNVIKDDKFLYAVGSSDTLDKAKQVAMSSMRKNLSSQLNKSFKDTNHILQPLDNKTIQKIFEQNADISKKLSLSRVKVIKSEKFQNKDLVLISIPREYLFNLLKPISDLKLNRAKQESKVNIGKRPIDRFIALNTIIDSYPVIASLTGYKEFLINKYDANDEYLFLKELKNEYDKLKKSINAYVLTDVNSKIFSPSIKNAFNANNITTKNSDDAKNYMKILVTSKTQNSQEYMFNKSKSLVQITTFDKSNNKIAFRQHTFVGKSRKNHLDAKQQSAIYLKNKIKKLGIFEFIGLYK